MAEPRKQGDQTPAVSADRTADAAVSEAPAPSNAGKKRVAVAWPSDRFVVEGLPVIDRKGVAVTAEQHKKLEEAAKKSGVQLREVND